MSATHPIDITLELLPLPPPEVDLAHPSESTEEEGSESRTVCASCGAPHAPYRFKERRLRHVTLLARGGWQIRLEVETLGWHGWPVLYYAEGFVGLVGWGRSIELGLLQATPPGEQGNVSLS